MKRSKVILISIAVVGSIGLAVWFLFFREKEVEITVDTQQPGIGKIAETVTSTGTIQPVDTVVVGSQVSGIISKIHADYNSVVKKGQLLAELDPTLLQATVDQYKGSLAEAESNEAYQAANFARQKQLYEVGAISKAAYDLAVNTYATSKAAVNSIKAQLRAAQKNLSFTKIYSPMDGVVLGRSVSVGQTVAASFSTPTLFSIAKDITKMQVAAKVDEADIGNVKEGQRVTFTVDAYLDVLFNGSVSEIRLQASTSSNVVTYTTIINASNDDLKLKPGMTATITIYTNEVSNALLIPVKAIKYTPDSSALNKKFRFVPQKQSEIPSENSQGQSNVAYVWVLENNNTIVQKKVKTGLNDNTQVQILEGLTAQDKIIIGTKSGATNAGNSESTNPFLPRMGKRR
ncbi:MAG: efflux RND transporter periplasmic adaptor subunit [Siphonobacter sp.]